MKQLHHLHFIGIGGIGMSALAYLMLKQGKAVSGSDRGDSPLLAGLRQEGAVLFRTHHANQVTPQTERVIFSEAIDQEGNPEFLRAQELGIPCLSYFEALGELSRHYKTIAIAGSHGKTTTTAMLGRALIEDGFDPLVIVGSRVPDFEQRNVYIGKGEHFVVEACEYRRSFLHLQPFGLVLLNCDPDHLDYYRDEADYRSAFASLIEKVPKNGFIVANSADDNLVMMVKKSPAPVILVHPREIKEMAGLKLPVPGDFNRMNALMAYKAALALGAGADTVIRNLNTFKGTGRRMEQKGHYHGALIIDDYGHHPTEVRETLRALKETYGDKRLICVFQPHQYSRTYQLLAGFKQAFGAADLVIVPNIYEARDTAKDKAAMDVPRFVQALKTAHPQVLDGQGMTETVAYLQKAVTAEDVVVTMGAGDVYRVGEALLKQS